MGYTTEFHGRFLLNQKLDAATHEFLLKLSKTRRVKRSVGPEYGIEGEFYVDAQGMYGQDYGNPNIVDYNQPPSTQPGLWCDWAPSEDGLGIEWNETEKFYYYVEWLEYLIETILAPRGYILNGKVSYRGEDLFDIGFIEIIDNVVTKRQVTF